MLILSRNVDKDELRQAQDEDGSVTQLKIKKGMA